MTGPEVVVLVASPSLFLEDGVQLRVIKVIERRRVCASVRSLFVKVVVFYSGQRPLPRVVKGFII